MNQYTFTITVEKGDRSPLTVKELDKLRDHFGFILGYELGGSLISDISKPVKVNHYCDNCKHFNGWSTASLAYCKLGDQISGFEAETCTDYEEVKE